MLKYVDSSRVVATLLLDSNEAYETLRFTDKIEYWYGVVSRGVKRFPQRLRLPEPPFRTPFISPGTYRIAVYFADSPVNLYQIRQWYEPLRELNRMHPVLIIARHEQTAKILHQESGLSVTYHRLLIEVEAEVERQHFETVLYVNQNARNFQMMRYGDPAHVFICHGESDKKYMSSRHHKAYDYSFIAGQAAKDRLKNALWGYDVEQRTIMIGRPQVDFYRGEPPYPKDERITVLYSPTWEGDQEAMAYGSIESHGQGIAETLLNDPRYRLVYRAHPRSGIHRPEYGEAHRKIVSMIAEANERDPLACHVHDEQGILSWQFTEPDVVICDVSAMLYDRLAVGKPLMVTRPINPQAHIEQGYLDHCEWLMADQAVNVTTEIERVLHDEEAVRALQKWSEHYFGPQAEAVTPRFLEAIEEVRERRHRLQTSHH